MQKHIKTEDLGIYRTAVAIGFLVVGAWYLHWRTDTFASDAPFFSALLYGAEIYGFFTAALHLFMTSRLTVRQAPAPQPGMSVDVFIPTYNESISIVRRTILAARNMDYKHVTWVLDDGNRPEMRALAEQLGVRYLARTDNRHAKAGNLNNALEHSEGEFIAIFDADHAPQRHFLSSTLGYFVDPKVAFVQTPQDFFNLDSYQHRWRGKSKNRLWTEQSLFFKVIQRGKDYWNSAFFCGSCAVVRRSALLDVKGFATESVTEDLHTSIRLHAAGYRSVYHAESLAFGIAPSSVAPFLKQRIRWGQGAMQVLKLENPLFNSKLTFPQRLNYCASILTYFDGWQKGIFYVAPVIVLLLGIMPIRTDALSFLLHFLPYYLLSFVLFEELGRGYGGTVYIEQYNFSRFAAFAWATLGLFTNKLKFTVTDKERSQVSEATRMFIPQLIVSGLNVVAVPVGLIGVGGAAGLPADAIVFNLVWAVVNLALGVSAIRFTRKTETFLRNEYRFPVPLPMTLDGYESLVGTVDDISSMGCRVYATVPPGVIRGSVISGKIYLPLGPLPFTARVVSEITGHQGDTTYTKAIGCEFIWDNQEAHNTLELFLYGTDLQWKLLQIEEQVDTPISWLQRPAKKARQQLGHGLGQHWATAQIIGVNGSPEQFGLVRLSAAGEVQKLLGFSHLGSSNTVRFRVCSRTSHAELLARVDAVETLHNSAGPIFVYSLSECVLVGSENTINTTNENIAPFNLHPAPHADHLSLQPRRAVQSDGDWSRNDEQFKIPVSGER